MIFFLYLPKWPNIFLFLDIMAQQILKMYILIMWLFFIWQFLKYKLYFHVPENIFCLSFCNGLFFYMLDSVIWPRMYVCIYIYVLLIFVLQLEYNMFHDSRDCCLFFILFPGHGFQCQANGRNLTNIWVLDKWNWCTVHPSVVVYMQFLCK